eukprot:4648543-Pleurochrysis_carterae.AAC.3
MHVLASDEEWRLLAQIFKYAQSVRATCTVRVGETKDPYNRKRIVLPGCNGRLGLNMLGEVPQDICKASNCPQHTVGIRILTAGNS